MYFDQETVDRIGENTVSVPEALVEAESVALAACIKKLPATDVKLIECRYEHALGTRQISELLDRSQASVCNSLKRIRSNLLRCIRRQLSSDQS